MAWSRRNPESMNQGLRVMKKNVTHSIIPNKADSTTMAAFARQGKKVASSRPTIPAAAKPTAFRRLSP
jgi:hypothetical protein